MGLTVRAIVFIAVVTAFGALLEAAGAAPGFETDVRPVLERHCEQCRVSTTGPRALTFLNGDFAVEAAGELARRVVREVGDDPSSQVTRAFELLYGRGPGPQETRATLDFLRGREGGGEFHSKAAKAAGLEGLTSVLLNSNEFFYLH